MLFINKKKLTKSEINLKLLNKYKVNINELNYDKLKEFKEKVKALSDGRQKGLLKMDMIKIMFKLIIVRIVLKNFHIFILPNNLGHNDIFFKFKTFRQKFDTIILTTSYCIFFFNNSLRSCFYCVKL